MKKLFLLTVMLTVLGWSGLSRADSGANNVITQKDINYLVAALENVFNSEDHRDIEDFFADNMMEGAKVKGVLMSRSKKTGRMEEQDFQFSKYRYIQRTVEGLSQFRDVSYEIQIKDSEIFANNKRATIKVETEQFGTLLTKKAFGKNVISEVVTKGLCNIYLVSHPRHPLISGMGCRYKIETQAFDASGLVSKPEKEDDHWKDDRYRDQYADEDYDYYDRGPSKVQRIGTKVGGGFKKVGRGLKKGFRKVGNVLKSGGKKVKNLFAGDDGYYRDYDSRGDYGDYDYDYDDRDDYDDGALYQDEYDDFSDSNRY